MTIFSDILLRLGCTKIDGKKSKAAIKCFIVAVFKVEN